jgi:hypothetical protein
MTGIDRSQQGDPADLGTTITRMPRSWRQCATMFTKELLWLKGCDLELVMARAMRLDRLEIARMRN